MDDDFENEDSKFENEYGAFNRAGGTKLSELLSTPEGKSPEDLFLIKMDAFCRKLDSGNIVKITENDINILLDKTTVISNLKYKNYIGYVLGYIATQGGRTMDIKNIQEIINILPKIDNEAGIEPPDIVRYARFWMTI